MQVRLGAALAATALTAATLAACGSDSGGSSEPADFDDETISAEGEKLTVWIMEGNAADFDPYFEDLGTAFTDETGAELDVQYIPWTAAHDKFTTAMAGDTTPDVAEVGSTWTGEFGEAGGLYDLSEEVEQADLGDDFVPSLVEAGTLDGALYGMPWYAGTRSIVYRTDVLEKAGVEPPTSWDELVSVGQAIKQSDPDIVPMAVPGESEYSVLPFIWGAGGDVAEEQDGTWTSTIDSEEAQQGVQFYTDLAVQEDLSTPAATTWDEAEVSEAFGRGEVAMMIAGNWTIAAVEEAAPELKGKLGAVPIPGPDGGMSPSFLGGSNLSVFQSAENPDLAWALVKMMSTGEYASKWADVSGFFPGEQALLEEIQSEGDPLVAPFAKQAAEASASVPATPLYGQVQAKLTVPAMVQSILTGKATVEEATATAADEMDEIFSGG